MDLNELLEILRVLNIEHLTKLQEEIRELALGQLKQLLEKT